MKAEEPGDRVPVVKYGMGVSEQHKIVERHFALAEEREAISTFHFVHALHVGPALHAALDAVGARAPEVSPPFPTVAEPEVTAPDDLRSSLGLS